MMLVVDGVSLLRGGTHRSMGLVGVELVEV